MPRRKSERQAKKTTTSKKTKKSTTRKSTKKKADEVPKKRKRSTKEPKRKMKRAKKTVEAEATELTELQIIEVTSPLAKSVKNKEKAKVSKQVIVLKEKLTTLKMEMKEVLEKGERKQEQCINLETEILRLQRLVDQKVEKEMKKDEEITGILAQAESQSKSYEAALNEKEVELKRCLGDIKLLQQNLLACEEKHKKTKTFFEDALKKERAKDSHSSSNLTRKLKETEDAYREGQRKLNHAQSRYAKTQKLLEQSMEKVRISEEKAKSLGAELNKMSKQLEILEGKKKVMGMTIREGTKGRMKLRKMLDETRRAKVHAEAALLTKESEYSKQVQELRTQLAALQTKSSPIPV